MKIIIPMAGLGKRMRPHTLTVPKPLIPVAGKPIVERLVEDLAAMSNEKLEEIAFVVGRFGEEVEKSLLKLAEKIGAKGKIYYQDEPLGTAHAILCAGPSLSGHLVVAFADTLFHADFKIDIAQDGIIWTNRIADPSSFGVVETDDKGLVVRLWEKPKEFVSDQAIIGIYYFKDGERLKAELQALIDKDVKVKGEYQLTDALENLRKNGARFRTAAVNHWLDCGNKDATVETNRVLLDLSKNDKLVSDDLMLQNSIIIPPCYIGKGVRISNSVIGPYASVGNNTSIESSVVSNSIIMSQGLIKDALLKDSMLGNYSSYEGKAESVNLSDYSEVG